MMLKIPAEYVNTQKSQKESMKYCLPILMNNKIINCQSMTDPNEGYTCWRLKNGQYCDDCPEYSNCSVNNNN